MVYYAITVKTLGGESPGIEDYVAWNDLAQSRGMNIQVYTFEFDSEGKLHMHGVGESRRGFYAKRLDFRGYHKHIVPLTTIKGMMQWMRYMYKDYRNPDLVQLEAIQENFPVDDRNFGNNFLEMEEFFAANIIDGIQEEARSEEEADSPQEKSRAKGK